MNSQDFISNLEQLSDEELQQVVPRIQFSVPWQFDSSIGTDTDSKRLDADGFVIGSSGGMFTAQSIVQMQIECWNKFVRNPLANTSVRDTVGRLCGKGFEVTSEISSVDEAIYELWTDWRNRLYSFFPKFVARADVEGELFLVLTVHTDGFVEVDFMDPGTLTGGDTEGTGIYFHPRKSTLPLAYSFETEDVVNGVKQRVQEIIPSIYVAYSPDLINKVALPAEQLSKSKNSNRKYKPIGGFYRFVIQWDKGYITKRNVSNLMTTIEWINHYENLKKYEIDHKKSSGSYLWVVEMEDPKTFRTWLSLTDEQRSKTGLTAKKTPGGTLMLPPGMKLQCINPNLTKISEQDSDILEMVISGLNKPSDQVTGSAKGTFASVKALKAPQSDRISDEIAYFERFLRYDFWKPIFFLKSAVTNFKISYNVEKVVDFDDEREPVKKKVKRNVWDLIDISFPTSEQSDVESQAKAFLGVKHGPVTSTLGIPRSVVAKKLGFSGNYKRYRLDHATEEESYPELIDPIDAESFQEQTEAEPPRNKNEKKDGGNSDGSRGKPNGDKPKSDEKPKSGKIRRLRK